MILVFSLVFNVSGGALLYLFSPPTSRRRSRAILGCAILSTVAAVCNVGIAAYFVKVPPKKIVKIDNTPKPKPRASRLSGQASAQGKGGSAGAQLGGTTLGSQGGGAALPGAQGGLLVAETQLGGGASTTMIN